MSRKLTSATTLDNLKKEAKRWLNALREGEAQARERFESAYPNAPSVPVLRDVQHALAREYGFDNWNQLKQSTSGQAAEYRRLAQDFVDAYDGDAAALQRLNAHYHCSFNPADLNALIWRRVYAFRQRSSRVEKNYLALPEAETLVAQDAGFGSWPALIQAAAAGTPPQGAAFAVDTSANRASPRRRMSPTDWDSLIETMREQHVTALDANGLMTDEVIARIVSLDHLTALNLGGSRELTDDGLLQLARMPQLEHLNLSEYPGGKLTDRGLEVLRHLPDLRKFEMCWQAGITDVGVANLRYCERLERVDLMGSPTGDGAIAALADKPHLHDFRSGRLVTDAGLAALTNLPALQTLLIDGPFTDAGVASVGALEELTDLDLFWHVTGITSEAFARLRHLPNLVSLGCDGKLSDDAAMRHIGALPNLRKLRAQESVATDEGFVALGQSKTLEGYWGRESVGFGSRSFLAFSKMPALRRLGVTLKNVDNDALSRLPSFPALRELTPIGLTDEGFRHVGRCARLERLTCMYCRESGDIATEHIAGLRELKYYYAGLTQITDRSLEILGSISSLEQIEFYECNGITDAGLPFLAALPNLREIHLDGSPGVTLHGTGVFPTGVRVHYST